MAIKYCFKGQVSNEEIHKFYRENYVDCFITTSSSEGLPVSIMEAMSYGIPIIATDVGGIREMIDGNGELLSANPDQSEVANAIVSMFEKEIPEIATLRSKSRFLWEKNYNAATNAKQFASLLYDISECDRRILIMTIDSVRADWCFIKHELIELTKLFRVVLVESKPSKDESIYKQELEMLKSANLSVELLYYHENDSFIDRIPAFIEYFFDKSIRTERRDIFNSRKMILRRIWESMKYYSSAKLFYKWIINQIKLEPENTVFYSFWQQDTTLAACMNKGKMKIYTRTHGYDLYNERYEKGYRQPFRIYMDELLDGIFFISRTGKEYYLEHFAQNNSDIWAQRMMRMN